MTLNRKLTRAAYAASALMSVSMLTACGNSDNDTQDGPTFKAESTQSQESKKSSGSDYFAGLEDLDDLNEDDLRVANWTMRMATAYTCVGSYGLTGPNDSVYGVARPDMLSNTSDNYEMDDATKTKLSEFAEKSEETPIVGLARRITPNAPDYRPDYEVGEHACNGDPLLQGLAEGAGHDSLENYFYVSDDHKKLTLKYDQVAFVSASEKDARDEDGVRKLEKGTGTAEFVIDLDKKTITMTDDDWMERVDFDALGA